MKRRFTTVVAAKGRRQAPLARGGPISGWAKARSGSSRRPIATPSGVISRNGCCSPSAR